LNIGICYRESVVWLPIVKARCRWKWRTIQDIEFNDGNFTRPDFKLINSGINVVKIILYNRQKFGLNCRSYFDDWIRNGSDCLSCVIFIFLSCYEFSYY
jgi:hypothetical protein